MEDAGIHNFNLVTYTSILPREAEEISFTKAQRYFHHGAVLECILSEQHGGRGDRITAGVGRMMVCDKDEGGRPMGGFAVEYEGHAMEDVAEQQLDWALDELFARRFDSDSHSKGEKRFAIRSGVVHQAFGTAIAGICFVDYIVPILSTDLAGGSREQATAVM
ncbi:pyruvoyl-dependent arginine decarboxylase [Micractinium conductrix]|uniref:arginine decarboxylase n=1 Tax=Micractinium conductrix TaxID=554055 RepID=A0A2P6VS91_9CHLO|nr:pyruvoyl-dependent arginine decarboxylase [Micractinium conductrix]|eukprot:PSC76952.1 pyruvoyl-dependent arginine decarboxylase [Micractinium conductrix]